MGSSRTHYRNKDSDGLELTEVKTYLKGEPAEVGLPKLIDVLATAVTKQSLPVMSTPMPHRCANCGSTAYRELWQAESVTREVETTPRL